MALIPCPNCRNIISDKAVICPKCGYNFSQRQPVPNVENNPDVDDYLDDYDSLEWYMWLIFICLGWIIPLIYYFVKRGSYPNRARQALIALVINIALCFFLFMTGACDSILFGIDYYDSYY